MSHFWNVHLFSFSLAEISNGFATRQYPDYLQEQRETAIGKDDTKTPFINKSLYLLPCAREIIKAKTAKEKKKNKLS